MVETSLDPQFVISLHLDHYPIDLSSTNAIEVVAAISCVGVVLPLMLHMEAAPLRLLHSHGCTCLNNNYRSSRLQLHWFELQMMACALLQSPEAR